MNKMSQIKNACSNPNIFIIDNFLSSEECEHFIELTKNKVTGNNSLIVDEGKTNTNCYIENNFDDITSNVANRISKLLELPIERAESFQLIHCNKEEHYELHLSGFPMNNSNESHKYLYKSGQRMLSALVYLNTEEAGETNFPKLGLTIEANKGKIVIFENSDDTHQESYYSETSVTKGVTYAFNLWFKEINTNEIYNGSLIKPHLEKDENILNNKKITTAIFSTMGKPNFLETWLNYHFKLKIDKIYILYDKTNFPESNDFFKEIESKYENLFVYLSEDSEKLINKQKLNFKKVKKILQKDNIDFVFHIDDDELIYLEDNLNNILNHYENEKMALHFNNYEVLKTNKTTEKYNFFENEKYFKKRSCGLYNSYFNGKGGGFVKNMKWNGPHYILTNNKKCKNIDKIKILHFPFMIYEQWKNKYNIVQNINKLKFPFHKKSEIIINQFKENKITDEELKQLYLDLMNCNLNIEKLLKSNKIFKLDLHF
jgi:prolyl 4-hydroxylase